VHAKQLDRLPLPVAEIASRKIGVIEDRIEAGGVLVIGVVIPGSKEERGAKTDPVSVVREFYGGHLSVDVLRLVGDRIAVVTAPGPVKGVGNVIPTDVPVTSPAQVGNVQTMRRKRARRVGADQEVVLVEVKSRPVMVVMHAHLGRVAGEEKILAIIVGDVNVLMMALESV